MGRKLTIVAAIALGVAIASVNFFYFYVNLEIAFQFHNAAALALGVALVAIAYVLLKRRSGSKALHFSLIVTGLWMTLAHVVKLAIGHCI